MKALEKIVWNIFEQGAKMRECSSNESAEIICEGLTAIHNLVPEKETFLTNDRRAGKTFTQGIDQTHNNFDREVK